MRRQPHILPPLPVIPIAVVESKDPILLGSAYGRMRASLLSRNASF